MGEICRFCDILNGNASRIEDRKIWENNSYFALASIGALIEGWVLIIPKNHVVSMKDEYANKQFVEFASLVLNEMKIKYSGPFIAFEHGPNRCGSNTSCGTNHAHLHIVPYQKSLYKDMIKTGLAWESCTTKQIASKVGINEYLFYSEIPVEYKWDNPDGYLHILEQPISQYFRRLIANQMNCPDEYDYKKYPHIDVAIKTNNVLSPATTCS